jgi:hypothetical protein
VGCVLARPTGTLTESLPQPGAPASRRGPIGWIVAGSLVVGAGAAFVLVWLLFAGAREHVITGTALLGFALALLELGRDAERLVLLEVALDPVGDLTVVPDHGVGTGTRGDVVQRRLIGAAAGVGQGHLAASPARS